jgi:hypothetical protein
VIDVTDMGVAQERDTWKALSAGVILANLKLQLGSAGLCPTGRWLPVIAPHSLCVPDGCFEASIAAVRVPVPMR